MGWWEYCMYDWQNRYNYSWRIRTLYVLNLRDKQMQRPRRDVSLAFQKDGYSRYQDIYRRSYGMKIYNRIYKNFMSRHRNTLIFRIFAARTKNLNLNVLIWRQDLNFGLQDWCYYRLQLYRLQCWRPRQILWSLSQSKMGKICIWIFMSKNKCFSHFIFSLLCISSTIIHHFISKINIINLNILLYYLLFQLCMLLYYITFFLNLFLYNQVQFDNTQFLDLNYKIY